MRCLAGDVHIAEKGFCFAKNCVAFFNISLLSYKLVGSCAKLELLLGT
jgi:hypothetical protein